MIKRMVIMLIAVGIVICGFFAFQNFKAHIIQQVMATMANPPQTVATVTAGSQDWQPQAEAVGSLRAVNGADLALEVAGIVGRSSSTPAMMSPRAPYCCGCDPRTMRRSCWRCRPPRTSRRSPMTAMRGN